MTLAAIMPVQEAGNAAKEGTAGHKVAELCLNNSQDAEHYIGQEVEGVHITADIAEHVQVYVDILRNQLLDETAVLFTELKINYGTLLGIDDSEAFGTSDAVIVINDTAYVYDLKLGSKYVEARNNVQLSLYALGAVDALEFSGYTINNVELVIVQPKISMHPQHFVTSALELTEVKNLARAAVAFNLEAENTFIDPPTQDWVNIYLKTGEEQCRYCRAKSICPALNVVAQKTLLETAVSNIGEDLIKIPLLEQWIEAKETLAFSTAMNGDKVPMHKVVLGRQGNRKWAKDESEILAELIAKGVAEKDLLTTPSLLTPAKIEKIIDITEYVVRSDGRPTLVLDTDPRPEHHLVSTMAEDFA
jgi:hypothetical protein